MKKLTHQIFKYICATLSVVALVFFAGFKIDSPNLANGSSDSSLVSVNQTTTKYVVAGGRVYLCEESSDDDAVVSENASGNAPVASIMDKSSANLQAISIYNSNLEFVFLKDGLADYSTTVQALVTTPVSTQLTDEIASIVTATLTNNSVEITIEDQKQTADVSTSLDAVYSLNSLALSVNSSLQYDNGNFMVSSSQASVSLLATSMATALDQKSALVMKLDSGSVNFKGSDSSNPVVYQPKYEEDNSLGMGRAFYINGGNLTIGENVVLTGFSATDASLNGGKSGGAIYSSGSASSSILTLNCTITNCKATSSGGAIYSNCTIIINGGQYSKNTSSNGEGGFIYNYRNSSYGGVVTLNSGIIDGNTCGSGGGAIWSSNVVNLNGGYISNNKAYSDNGGGVDGSTININGTIITGNYGDIYGGGIYGSTVNFTSGKVSSNSTDGDGGGIYATTCTVAAGAKIDDNGTTGSGGGIYAKTLKFTGSATISNNTALLYGGGIYIPSGGSYTSSGESICNNYAGECGGGLYYASSSTSLTLSCSIYQNESSADGGGGVCAYSAPLITLNNARIYENKSTVEGGGLDCNCVVIFTGGNSDMGVYNNTCNGQGRDIYFGGSSNYIQLNLGINYGKDSKTCSVYKAGLKTTASGSNMNMILKSSSNSYASKFRSYLTVENFSMPSESTYQCRMNLIEWDDTTTTSLYAEKDVCLLSFKPGNEWTDYNSGHNVYYDDNIYACFTDKAKTFSGSSAVVTTSGRSWQFSNNFTVNFWASMSYWSLYTSEKVMASSGVSSNNKGWKFMYGTDGAISCALYDSGTSAYKYINLQTKYSNLTNGKAYMFTLTVSSSNYATLYLSQGGKIVDYTSVQLSGSVGYYYVVGPNTSSTVLGGQSSGTGSVASGHYWDGTMQMFEIVNETWTTEIIEQICTEDTAQGAGVFKMGMGGETYTLATPPHPSTKSFAYWAPEQEFSGYIKSGENVFTFASNDETYLSRMTGIWTTGTYMVIYDANGGTGTMSSQTFNHTHTSSDGTYKLNTNTFTRDGYTFLGWATSSTATSAKYGDGYVIAVGGDPLTTNGSIRLYAVWEAHILHITLDRQGSSTGTIGFYYEFGTNKYASDYSRGEGFIDVWKSAKVTCPSKTGYTFVGYYTGKNGSEKRWIDSNGFLEDGLYKTISKDTTLYAYFKPNTITITLNHQGGTSSVTTLYCQYGVEDKYYYDEAFTSRCTSIKTPTLTGKNFMGYYENPASYTSSSAVQYIDANGNIKSNLCTATTGSSITIYANWQTKTYEVIIQAQKPNRDNNANFNNCWIFLIYNKDRGSSSYSSTSETYTLEHGTTMTFNSGNQLTFVKDGTVVGWVIPRVASVPTGYTVSFSEWLNATGTITGSRTITAKFVATPVEYTMKFVQLTKSNTQLYTDMTKRTELTLTASAGSNSNRWYYETTYTIEDEFILPYVEKDHYTVGGWQVKTNAGNWTDSEYACCELINANEMYGNVEFKMILSPDVFIVKFVCDPDDAGRASLITNSYSELNETIYIPYNGTLADDAYYEKNNSTKVYLSWSEMPTSTGLVGWYKNSSFKGSSIGVSTQFTATTFTVDYNDEGDAMFVIYAKWQPVTIVYYGKTPLGQGKVNSNISTGYGKTIQLKDPITETTSGWTFKGWYTKENGQGDRFGGAGETKTVEITVAVLKLYAYWVGNKYTITWHGATTTGSSDGLLQSICWDYTIGDYLISNNGNDNRTKNYTNSDKVATSEVVYGSSQLGYRAPTPVRVGYTFVAWIDKSGRQIIYSDDLKTFYPDTSDDAREYTNADGIWDYIGNADLYASWSSNSYSITVDRNNGTSTYQLTYSVSRSVTISDPQRTGYTFTGWNVQASLNRVTKASINIDNGYLEYDSRYPIAVFYEPFYLQQGVYYTANKRSANGASAEIRWRVYSTSGAFAKTISIDSKVKGTGQYTMLWYHKGDTNQSETIEYTAAAGDAFNTYNQKSTGDLTLTAQWETNKYTISYALDGGSLANQVSSVSYGTLFSVSTPTKTGYLFTGWEISGMDGITHSYGTASSLKTTTYTTLTTDDTATTFKNLRSTAGTVTFKALWMAKNIEITISNSDKLLKYFFAGSYYYITSTTKLYGRPGDNELKVATSSSSNSPKYYSNGGFYDYVNHQKVQVSVTGIKLVNNREGYTYNGLYSGSTQVVDASGVVQPSVIISNVNITDANGYWAVSNTNSLALTASWIANTYTIEFAQATLHSCVPTVSGLTKISDYKYTATYGSRFTVDNLTKVGSPYEFVGWYITNKSNKIISTGTTSTGFTNLTTTNGDVIKFKALWKTKYIKLNISNTSGLQFGDNNLSTDCLYVRYDSAAVYYIPTAYQNSVYHVEANRDEQATDIYYTGSIYASVPDGQITTVTTVTCTLTGYYFAGLNSASGDRIFNSSLSRSDPYDHTLNYLISNAQEAGELSLSAVKLGIPYTVKLELNGGTISGSNNTISAQYGSSFTVANPTKDGYDFAGWYITGMDSGVKHYYGITALTNTTTSTSIQSTKANMFQNLRSTAGTVTFTATWTAKQYTVTFDANGGSCTTASKQVSYASTYGTLPTPTRTGYAFKGWYYGDTQVTSATTVTTTSAHTLSAHWEAVTLNITYILYNYDTQQSASYADDIKLRKNLTTLPYSSSETNSVTIKTGDKLTVEATNVPAASSELWYGVLVNLKQDKLWKELRNKRNDYNYIKDLSFDLTYDDMVAKLSTVEDSTVSITLKICAYYNGRSQSSADYLSADKYRPRYNVYLSNFDGTSTKSITVSYDPQSTSLNKITFSGNSVTYKNDQGTSQTITTANTYSSNGTTYTFSYWKDSSGNKVSGEVAITGYASFTAVYVATGKIINYECYYDYETCTDVYLVVNGQEYRGKGTMNVTTSTVIEILAKNVKALNTETNGIWSSYPFTDSSASNGGYAYSTSYAGGSNVAIEKKFVDLSTLFTRSDTTLIIRSTRTISGTTTYGNVPTSYVIDYTLYHPWEVPENEKNVDWLKEGFQYKLYARYSVLNSNMTSTTTKEILINTATTTSIEREGQLAYGEGMEFISEFVNLALLSSEINDVKIIGNMNAGCYMTYNGGNTTTTLIRMYSNNGLSLEKTSDDCTCYKGHSLYTMRILIGDISSSLSIDTGYIDVVFDWGYWNG